MPVKLKHYHLVQEHPLRIISKCKSHSKGTLMSFLIGFSVLYAVINWVPQILALFFPATNLDLVAAYTNADPEMLSRMPGTPLVLFFYLLLFNGVFKLSEALYTLTYIRNRTVEYSALTESLNYYLKTLGIFLLQTVIVSFWTMFFVIPGIMAAINFSQAFYILADDPDKSVTQVLAESKMMMYGNRMNYVRLIICYIPYILMAYLPAFIISSLVSGMALNNTVLTIIGLIADLPLFFAYGYMSLGRTVFYELMLNDGFAAFKYAGQDAFRESETTDQLR